MITLEQCVNIDLRANCIYIFTIRLYASKYAGIAFRDVFEFALFFDV